MMRVLKLQLFQETASYTKPFAIKVGETYPLPPYSTVIGMLHRVLGATSYQEMRIGVQGTYEDKFIDQRKSYLYKKNEVTTFPLYIHLLYGVKLVIHVHAEPEILTQLYKRLSHPMEYLSLGRREDLVRLDQVEWTELSFQDPGGEWVLKNNIYIPDSQLEQLEYTCGVHYRLNTKYRVVHNIRKWETVDVLYLAAGDLLHEEAYWFDQDKDVVYFHSSPQ